MDNDILSRMEAEEVDLAQKLDAVRQFLAVYRGKPTKAQRVEAPATRQVRTLEQRLDKFGPYGQRIVDTTETLLPGNGGNPVTTRTLVEQLLSLGVEITGENKVNSLSALLARSSKMKGYGRAGWTLQSADAGKRYPFRQEGSVPNENEAPNTTHPDGVRAPQKPR
jgi:hypothetical protein